MTPRSHAASLRRRSASRRIWIGDFEVDAELGEVRRCGEAQACAHLEPKMVEVLEVLVEKPGEVVSRARMLARVWPDVHVSDSVLWRCIYELRRAFNDDPQRANYIATVPRRGYRVVASVGALDPREPVIGIDTTAPRSPRPRWGVAAALAGAALLGVVRLGSLAGPNPLPDEVTRVARPTSDELVDAAASAIAREPGIVELTHSIRLYRRVLAEDPGHASASAGMASALCTRASLSASAEELRDCLRVARRSITLAPRSAAAHSALAQAYAARGWLRLASVEFGRALGLGGGDAVRIRAAEVAWQRGAVDQTVILLHGLSTAARTPARSLLLARAYRSLDWSARALEVIEAGLALAPWDAPLTAYSAELVAAQGAPARALDRLDDALAIAPDSIPLRVSRMRIEAARVAGDMPARQSAIAETLARDRIRLREALDQGDERWNPWIAVAESAALSGDIEGAHNAFAGAVTRGYLGSELISEPLGTLLSSERFSDLTATIQVRAAELRARLAVGQSGLVAHDDLTLEGVN